MDVATAGPARGRHPGKSLAHLRSRLLAAGRLYEASVGVGGPATGKRAPGGDAESKINSEQSRPEFRDGFPDFPPAHDVNAFHDEKHHRQAKRQRDEQKVVHRRQCEL